MRIALTFDDGPSAEWTPAILDILAQHDAKVTFFVTGHAISHNPSLLERIGAAGHEVANHTYTHARLTDLDDIAVEHELAMTSELIFDTLGDYPAHWRAPHFATDQRINEIAAELGMTHVPCTIDPGDWLNTPGRIAEIVLTRAHDRAIVDLHDGIPPDGGTGAPTRQATVEALPHILNLDAEFLTIADLWASTPAT